MALNGLYCAHLPAYLDLPQQGHSPFLSYNFPFFLPLHSIRRRAVVRHPKFGEFSPRAKVAFAYGTGLFFLLEIRSWTTIGGARDDVEVYKPVKSSLARMTFAAHCGVSGDSKR